MPSSNENKLRAAYAVLGLEDGADLNQVRRAWKAKLRDVHKDHYADDPETKRRAQQAASRINQAYNVLRDALF